MAEKSSAPKSRVGPAGWSYKDWIGIGIRGHLNYYKCERYFQMRHCRSPDAEHQCWYHLA
jgi:hypothetical protein